jgi:hypothetical protein
VTVLSVKGWGGAEEVKHAAVELTLLIKHAAVELTLLIKHAAVELTLLTLMWKTSERRRGERENVQWLEVLPEDNVRAVVQRTTAYRRVG